MTSVTTRTVDHTAAIREPCAQVPSPLRHLAIIPDGNRRWSKRNGVSLERTYVDACTKMFDLCKWLLNNRGTILEVSLFFVSAENLRARRRTELDPLFSAGLHFLDLFYSETAFNHVDLRWVGLHDNDFAVDSSNYGALIDRVRQFERPSLGTRRCNVLCGYDVRKDIESAMSSGTEFRYENLSVHRPVDLIIRSGGQKRLSGFLPLVCQYAEFEFVDKLFPDIDEHDVAECIDRFEGSARRFGV